MHEDADIVIAGVGLITPLGHHSAATWRELLAGGFLTDHGRTDARGDEPNVIELAAIAAREAIAADCRDHELRSDRTARVGGTSKGPADEWLAPIGSESSGFPRTTGLRGTVWRAPASRPPTSDNPSIHGIQGECESVTTASAVMTAPAGP